MMDIDYDDNGNIRSWTPIRETPIRPCTNAHAHKPHHYARYAPEAYTAKCPGNRNL